MRLKEMTLNKGLTLSIGKYEFVRAECSLTVSFDEDDDLEDVKDYLRKEVDRTIQHDIDETMENLGLDREISVSKPEKPQSKRPKPRRA